MTLVLLASLFSSLPVWVPRCQGDEGEKVPTFRRLLLSPERLGRELKNVKDGVLVRLPLAEFDSLVERATHAGVRKEPPRLVEARYHATLKDESLIGEGQWKLVHKGPEPGLLPLKPFNLALRQARFENGDALIAAFDGTVPALLVESAGERTLSLDWSARAEASREGLQFHLEIPACPVALLELDVPAKHGVTVLNDGTLLSGPYEAENDALRRWKIACSGSRIDIRILPADRPAAGADQAPLVRQKTLQKLHPQGLDAAFELTLDGLSRGVRELVCECDPELRLRDVAGPNVESYSFQGGKAGHPSRLTIRLREAMRGGTWQVLCLAPLQGGTGVSPVVWRSPGIRLVNGVPCGETVTLWFHPEVRLENWDAGSFRLSSADLDRATGSQVLTLLGGGLGPPRRPAARLQVHGVEFRAHQLVWCRCGADGMALTVQIGWDVSRGQLFQLPVQLPAGWRVEKVEMNPTRLLRDWRVGSAAGKAMLFVDLARPLGPPANPDAEPSSETPSRPAAPARARLPQLIVHLRPGWSGPFAGKNLPFPDVVPLGACFREGALALDCDEQLFSLDVRTRAERSPPPSEGPWGAQLPEQYYPYSVPVQTDQPPVKGEFQVRARPPRLHARCNTEVFVSSGRAAVETHLRLEAEAGSPETIDLLLSFGDGGPWQWRTEDRPRGDDSASNRVRGAERLLSGELSTVAHLLAARNPLQSAVLLAARPTSERWRLTLARPLRVRETLHLFAQRPLQPRQHRWDVPLPVVLDADRMEGEVTLHLAGTDLVHLDTRGLRETASTARQGAPPWRSFRYGQSEVGLSLSGPTPALDRSSVAVIERARLVSHVSADGVLRHCFSFDVRNWNQRTLSLELPPGSRPLAVKVDGRWLPQLIPASTAEERGGASRTVRSQAESGNEATVELALPVPGRGDAVPGEAVHRFEVVYTHHLPTWLPWQVLDAPMPRLPVPPLSFRRVWRLSPKLVPLHQGRYQPLAGTVASGAFPALPHHVAELFRLPGSWSQWDPLLEDRQAGAREALDRAIHELRGRYADRKLTLREAVNNLALILLRDRYYLLIDARALREAGVVPDILLPPRQPGLDAAAPWAECGLVAVPSRSAILLTTNAGLGARLREPLTEDVEQALAKAATRGQDPSGRFRSALSWLQSDPFDAPSTTPLPALDFEGERSDWSEWEPIAGRAQDRLIVVRRDLVTGIGLGLAVFLALGLGILRRRSGRPRLLLLLLALGASGLGVLWLPAALRDLAWWPLLAGCLMALLGYVRAVARRRRDLRSTLRKAKKALSAAAIGGILVFSLLGWHGRAAAPAPVTVYLLPASADAPDRPSVLVPAEFLDRLRVLARPAPLTPEGRQAVLLDASYEGQLLDKGRLAEFTAVFAVHNLTEEASTLILPLSGVQPVDEMFLLDGARTSPQTLPEPQAGYSLPVRGRGRHRLELRFRVPVAGTDEDRNVLFTLPPLLRSRLSWRIPPGASGSQVLAKYGAQWTTRDAGGERLEADLGALPRPFLLHWYQPRSAARVTYQAAYVWDLGIEASRLTAWLRYRIERGAVSSLEVDLPAELEVSSATAQRTIAGAPPAWLTRFRLHDWYVAGSGGKRKLQLTFPYPISGDFQVRLELLPRAPLSSRTALPLPSPHGDAHGKLHYLAYRTHVGLNAQRDTSLNLTRIGEKEFAPDWPTVPRLEANFSGVAYKIAPEKPPKLFLRLQHAPPAVQAEVDLTLKVGTRRTEIQAVAQVEAPNKDLAAVEWELPSPHCTIVSVDGENVRSWKQNGPRLLVWLNRTAARTPMRLTGLLPESERAHLSLSALRLHPSGKQHTRLHLVAAGGLALEAPKVRNLRPVQSERRKNEKGSEGELPLSEFETWDAFYHLDCGVRPAGNAVARVLTLGEVADRELRFTATVDYTIRQGELRQVQLRLRNWEDEKVDVQAERVKRWPGPRRSAGERSWLLPLEPGVAGHYQVTLRGRMPLDRSAVGVPMPEVIVQGVERPEYYLATAGGELTGQARGSLQPLQSPAKTLQPFWPGAAQRLERSGGQGWRVQGSEWQLQLLPHARTREPAPVHVYLLEQSAAVVDGRRWLHETHCWLRHEAHADLHFDFPAPVNLLTAAVEDVEVTPHLERGQASGSTTGARVWLPLPGRPGIRCIRLRWLYDPPEPLEQPNLTPPRVADAVQGTTLWTVRMPAGWDIAQSNAPTARLGSGAAREAALALHRAEAQLQISQDLLQQRGDSALSAALAASRQRFALYVRHARQALDGSADRGDVRGPQGQSLEAWLEALQAKNRVLQPEPRQDSPSRRKEDREKDEVFLSACLPVSRMDQGGTPMSWRGVPAAEPLALQLTLRETQRTRQVLAASGQWLGSLVVIWILSFLPFLLARLRLFWPEQIGVLGAVGWHMAGLTSVVLLFVLTAAFARGFLLARGLRRLFRKRRNQASTMTPGSGMIP